MKKVTWTVKATLESGEQYFEVKEAEFEATKTISVTVSQEATAADAGHPPVQVSLAAIGTHVKLLFVRLSSGDYDGISYKAADGGDYIDFEFPHLYAGAGAVGLLDPAATPLSLWFKNTSGADVDVEVLVAGDATVSA